MANLTGNDILRLRQRLGISVAQLAELVGASVASIYRWESKGAERVQVDPFQARLLALMQERVVPPQPRQGATLADDIAKAIVVGGGLFGLYHLLDAVFGGEAVGGGRRSGGAVARSTRGRVKSSPKKKKKGRRA